ncbi:protein GPR107 [Bradysia coprophila]|uniref:protein GPR107 n=1 Tax=Bradysia coprophila TaxID=38358 RepID=UPI00187DBA98|nr:protein GPR107 [Bradysia coprophila]
MQLHICQKRNVNIVSKNKMQFKLIFIGLLLIKLCGARKHHLEVRDDRRRYIELTTFGFFKGGTLDVRLENFKISKDRENELFGLSLDKTMTDAMNPYLDSHQDRCILEELAKDQRSGPIVYFVMDLKNLKVKVTCSRDWQTTIFNDRAKLPIYKRQSIYNANFQAANQKTDDSPVEYGCNQGPIVIPITVKESGEFNLYSMSFAMVFSTLAEEGLYNLCFHACPNYKETDSFNLEFDVDIEENNQGNYLSAGEMPLPALYSMMSLLFFLSGLFWIFILRKSKHTVFKIHYIMAALVFLKSLSLMFHSINYHFIKIRGEHVEAWAILFYITHLLKGAVLFITIVLIGTGWTFIKHIIADKDKKVFMIVIPLQVLANIADIIIAESEEGDKEYTTWIYIFFLVDLLCCGAILFPVVWSIRHLQEASATDGKAATNLRKLKLFRQFYIMVVCYIYFTRIVVCLLKITVSFQYAWLNEMFKEMATYVFFVLTGYKFRPVSSHPYFQVETDDEEQDAEVLTETGMYKTKAINRTMVQSSTTIVDANDEERELMLNKRESSHEYD